VEAGANVIAVTDGYLQRDLRWHRMLLEIYVAPECPPCTEARAIASEMQALFPWLQVEVVELDGRRELPPRVVATPTYLLNGEIVSLGNPRRERLVKLIADNESVRRT